MSPEAYSIKLCGSVNNKFVIIDKLWTHIFLLPGLLLWETHDDYFYGSIPVLTLENIFHIKNQIDRVFQHISNQVLQLPITKLADNTCPASFQKKLNTLITVKGNSNYLKVP